LKNRWTTRCTAERERKRKSETGVSKRAAVCNRVKRRALLGHRRRCCFIQGVKENPEVLEPATEIAEKGLRKARQKSAYTRNSENTAMSHRNFSFLSLKQEEKRREGKTSTKRCSRLITAEGLRKTKCCALIAFVFPLP